MFKEIFISFEHQKSQQINFARNTFNMKNIYISGIVLSFLLLCTYLNGRKYEHILTGHFAFASLSSQDVPRPEEMQFDLQDNIFLHTLLYTPSNSYSNNYNSFLDGALFISISHHTTHAIDFALSASKNNFLYRYNFLTNRYLGSSFSIRFIVSQNQTTLRSLFLF